MKNSKVTYILCLIAGLSFFLTNCKKHKDSTMPSTPAPVCYPAAVNNNGSKYNDVSYDVNNRIRKITDYDPTTHAITDSIVASYNTAGKISRLMLYDLTNADTACLSFHYDTNNKLIADTTYIISSGIYVADSTNKYTYNSSDQIVKATYTGILSGGTGYTNYTYNASGNVSQAAFYTGTSLDGTVDYTYDTKMTLPPLQLWDLLASDMTMAFSAKNNIVSETHKDNTNTIVNAESYTATYSYNYSYPITRNDTYLDASKDSFTFTYTCK